MKDKLTISARSCGKILGPIRNAIDQLLDHQNTLQSSALVSNTEIEAKKATLINANGESVLNIEFSNKLPDNMCIMINGLDENLREFAHEYIKNKMTAGDIIVGKWVQYPPVLQKINEDRRISYHLPPMQIGNKPI